MTTSKKTSYQVLKEENKKLKRELDWIKSKVVVSNESDNKELETLRNFYKMMDELKKEDNE